MISILTFHSLFYFQCIITLSLRFVGDYIQCGIEHNASILLNYKIFLSLSFLWNSVSGDFNCSRGCSFVHCDDSMHHSWGRASDSFSDKDIGWNLCSCWCCWSFHQHPAGKCKSIINRQWCNIVLMVFILSLQVVVAPILLGSYLENAFPAAVKSVIPFAPLLAVLASSLLACRFCYLSTFDWIELD